MGNKLTIFFMLTDIGYRMNEYETVQLNRHDNRSLFSRPPRQKFTALEVSLSYLPAPPHIPTPTNIMIGLFLEKKFKCIF